MYGLGSEGVWAEGSGYHVTYLPTDGARCVVIELWDACELRYGLTSLPDRQTDGSNNSETTHVLPQYVTL